jgi:NIMA (never in mitosis gene a)-related kinase
VLEALRIFLSYEAYLLWQAADLLRHSHLQAYVLKVHLKLNSPRRSSLPVQWSESTYMKKTRFSEPNNVPHSMYREKRRSYSNDRTLNPSVSGADQDSLCSTLEIHDNPSYFHQRLQELSIGGILEETAISKTVVAKASDIAKSSRRTTARAAGPPKRSESVRFIISLSLSLSLSVHTHMHGMMVDV